MATTSRMNRIREHKAACERERRGRWWRDGLLGVCIGAVGGAIGVFGGYDPAWSIPIGAIGMGVLFGFCGPRTWPFLAHIPLL